MLYLDLFQALHAHQVRYLLVGGLAMNLHGVPRMTMDVDLVLAMDEANLDHFIDCAKSLGLVPLAPVPLSALKDPAQRKDWFEQKHMLAFGLQNTNARVPVMVDILIAPQVDIQQAFERSLSRDLNGLPIALACIEDMIALKTNTGRAQDESDIEHLERIRER
ncbi:MAG: nucleotidyl transferase AbiEii/AbiGii toxin family protein [Azonexus sp.]|nr:nucleotidyl transferase AbiEii/AbiGii toxin family protein [Azonexus sp.]